MGELMMPETRTPDPYKILGKMVAKHLGGKLSSSRITFFEETLGKIIADGFLDKIIEHQDEIVLQSQKNLELSLKARKEALEKRERELKPFNDEKKAIEMQVGNLKVDVMNKEAEIRRLDEKIGALKAIINELNEVEAGGVDEKDPYLSGAKKAYCFIMNQTGNKVSASKAFNSYLLLGKKADDADPYKSPKMKVGEAYKKKYDVFGDEVEGWMYE